MTARGYNKLKTSSVHLMAFLALIAAAGLVSTANAQEPSGSVTTEATKESPWLITPLLSVDPKLGRTIGALAGYVMQFDEESPASMVGAAVTYSNTDSYVGGVFADLYWQQDRNRLSLGGGFGKIKNDYDDFLGVGASVKTVDNFEAFFLRYLRRISDSPWFIGALLLQTDYQIDFPPRNGAMIDQVGFMGFDAKGAGLVIDFDTRDNVRNPSGGSYASLYNVAYRGDETESLSSPILPGLDQPAISAGQRQKDFDVYHFDARTYIGLGRLLKSERATLALEVRNRWTRDAPLSGYSSISLPGYTKGNYLGEDYSHLQFDLRLSLGARWGAVFFGGVGCLYGEDVSGRSSSCQDNVYPALGGGISYLLKPETGIVVRAEVAKGTGDNSALYLRFGHPF